MYPCILIIHTPYHIYPIYIYRYHPHVHGLTNEQVIGGASGALIINGIENIYPTLSGLSERVIILRDDALPTNTHDKSERLFSQNITASSSTNTTSATTTTNTDTYSDTYTEPPALDVSLNHIPITYPNYRPVVIPTQPNNVEFWRVVNAGTTVIYVLQFIYDNIVQPMHIIAFDGSPLIYNTTYTNTTASAATSTTVYNNTNTSNDSRKSNVYNSDVYNSSNDYIVTEVLLAPGQRVEFTITTPSLPTTSPHTTTTNTTTSSDTTAVSLSTNISTTTATTTAATTKTTTTGTTTNTATATTGTQSAAPTTTATGAASSTGAILQTLYINTGIEGDNNPTRTLAILQPDLHAPKPIYTIPQPTTTSTHKSPIIQQKSKILSLIPYKNHTLYFSQKGHNSDPSHSSTEGEPDFYIAEVGHKPVKYTHTTLPAIISYTNTVEDWEIFNTALEAHIFHIHQIRFLILQINNITLSFEDMYFRDTVYISAWSGDNSDPYPSVTLRMNFLSNIITGIY